jgi:hypothetical protein
VSLLSRLTRNLREKLPANKDRWSAGVAGIYCFEEYCDKCTKHAGAYGFAFITSPEKRQRCFCGGCFFCGKNRRYCQCTSFGILGGVCAYCEGNNLIMHSDHILPKSKFPEFAWEATENLILACNRCNSKKGVQLPSQMVGSSSHKWIESLEKSLLSAYGKIPPLRRRPPGSPWFDSVSGTLTPDAAAWSNEYAAFRATKKKALSDVQDFRHNLSPQRSLPEYFFGPETPLSLLQLKSQLLRDLSARYWAYWESQPKPLSPLLQRKSTPAPIRTSPLLLRRKS